MGIVSLINTNRLFWLGRYTERVYTTVKLFSSSFDRLIDADASAYEEFCRSLDIPYIYSSGEDFVDRYLFDEGNPDSVVSNLTRAYDNAIMLREAIGSECVSYIQLAIYAIRSLRGNQSPLLGLQKVVDDILAFWGLADDIIADANVRNIIKTGKRIERLDLFARLHMPKTDIEREIKRLSTRIVRTNLYYRQETIGEMLSCAETDSIDYVQLIRMVDGLVNV